MLLAKSAPQTGAEQQKGARRLPRKTRQKRQNKTKSVSS